jgi:leader peptidase (prepilin peptidase)/N-methyltransferase
VNNWWAESASVSTVAFGCLLLAIVVRIAVIDFKRMIIPDHLNIFLAGVGIAQAIAIGHPSLMDAGLGSLAGFILFSSLAALFRALRGIDGLGLGDQKFIAAAGLWVGWQALAPMLLAASLSALVFILVQWAKGQRVDLGARVPFGPFLGFGAFIAWVGA